MTRFGQKFTLLNHEIWIQITGSDATQVLLTGHPLDFRRSHLRRDRHACHKKCRGVTRRDKTWSVALHIGSVQERLGTAPSETEGYRIWNRRLRVLKGLHPED